MSSGLYSLLLNRKPPESSETTMKSSLAVNGVKERICAYEILERKYSYTIASTGFGAKHFYEYLNVQFANRPDRVTIQEQGMLMLKLSGFVRPILARAVYICHYEKKERPSVTFEVYFSQDDATNKNIYGRKARPTTTSSGLRGYRYVNIIPVKEELLKYDKLWSVDLGYLGELICPWDSKVGLSFYATMHLRHIDNDLQLRANKDPPKTCPVTILTAEAYYRYRCTERAVLALPSVRPAIAKLLPMKITPLGDEVQYLVFTRMLSHNKRLEEYPATRLAFDPKPRLRKDALNDSDFVDKIVLPESPVMNSKYDGPSNNLRSKESKRVLMRAMIILAEGGRRQGCEASDSSGNRLKTVTASRRRLPLPPPPPPRKRPEPVAPKEEPKTEENVDPSGLIQSKLLGPLTPDQARMELGKIKKKRGRPTKFEKALREDLEQIVRNLDKGKSFGRQAANASSSANRPEPERKPTRFVLNLTKPLTTSCTSNTTSASVARAMKRPHSLDKPGAPQNGERTFKRSRGRPRKYSGSSEIKEELSVLINAEPSSSSSLLSTGSNSMSSDSNHQLRSSAGTDSDRSSVTPPPPHSPASCESGTKSSSCGVHSPLTVMANSFEMMSLDGGKVPEDSPPPHQPPPPPPPPPPATSTPTRGTPRPVLNLELVSADPVPLQSVSFEPSSSSPSSSSTLLGGDAPLAQLSLLLGPPPVLTETDLYLLDPTIPTTDPAKCVPAHDLPECISLPEMDAITCIPSQTPAGSIWPLRGSTVSYPCPYQ